MTQPSLYRLGIDTRSAEKRCVCMAGILQANMRQIVPLQKAAKFLTQTVRVIRCAILFADYEWTCCSVPVFFELAGQFRSQRQYTNSSLRFRVLFDHASIRKYVIAMNTNSTCVQVEVIPPECHKFSHGAEEAASPNTLPCPMLATNKSMAKFR